MPQSLTLTPPLSPSNELPTADTGAFTRCNNAAEGTGAATFYRLNVAAPDANADNTLMQPRFSSIARLVYGVGPALGHNLGAIEPTTQQPEAMGGDFSSAPFEFGPPRGLPLRGGAPWSVADLVRLTYALNLMLEQLGMASLVPPMPHEKQVTADDLGSRVQMAPVSEVDAVMVAHYEGWGKPRRFRDPFADE